MRRKLHKLDPVEGRRIRARRAHQRLRKFKGVQFVKKVLTTSGAALAVGTATLHSAVPADGIFDATKRHDRWPIKTSAATNGPLSKIKRIDITDLANFAKPAEFEGNLSSSLIDEPLDNGLREGQIIQTVGYIHLVAFESGDSDYHIQMNANPTNESSDLSPCVIVEVPHPDATGDPNLSDSYARVREFIRNNCFGGNKPSGAVNPPVRVQVTGQLFFDQSHAHSSDLGGGRGKQVNKNPMHATTIWEIHPITAMQLAP